MIAGAEAPVSPAGLRIMNPIVVCADCGVGVKFAGLSASEGQRTSLVESLAGGDGGCENGLESGEASRGYIPLWRGGGLPVWKEGLFNAASDITFGIWVGSQIIASLVTHSGP